MNSDRKKPGVAFWGTVVVSVAVLYVLNSGPVMWVGAKLDSEGGYWFECIYSPLIWLANNGPAPIRDLLEWWEDFWTLPAGPPP